jgi:hypothetical protein
MQSLLSTLGGPSLTDFERQALDLEWQLPTATKKAR